MNNFESLLASPTPCLVLPDETLFGMPVWVKRDDLIHPVVSGNKYRKLKYPLEAAIKQYRQTGVRPTLVTMGGLWSNHVHATAYAAAALGMSCHALIRGHPGMDSAMLQDCRSQRMQIQFVDRVAYRALREDDVHWQTLVGSKPGQIWLPEGGSAPSALYGVAELIAELPFIPDVILTASGSGATLAGLLAGLAGRSLVIGIAVLENAGYLRTEVSRLLKLAGYPDYQNYVLMTEFHHGGYAKISPALLQFCHQFATQYLIPVEPIYTGKMFYALRELIAKGTIQRGLSVICLHTGGMQGRRGIAGSKTGKQPVKN